MTLSARIMPAKRKRYAWVRIDNDFPDQALFRAAAKLADARVHQVVAVALRMNCIANESNPRGSIADMNFVEFAAALQLNAKAVARIRTALEDPTIAWIVDGFIADFYERNPEECDQTAADRQRRRRANVREADRELALMSATGPPEESRRDVTPVTPRNVTDKTSLQSEVPRARAREPAVWLAEEGTKIVAARLNCEEGDAMKRITRWLEACRGDATALCEIIATRSQELAEAKFHIAVADACQRHAARQLHNNEPELPFGPIALAG
jgi:hypothetical protein